METTTAMALNDEQFRALEGMVNKDDGGGDAPQIPVLKINYDEDSVYDKGVWVVGQMKDQQGVIVDQGSLVNSLVLLTARHRYSYYVQGDPKAACSSPFFIQKPGAKVVGHNYGYVCGKSCPFRAEGRIPRCKAQVAFFVSALTVDNKLIDSIVYLSGSGYMPGADYAKLATSQRVRNQKGQTMELPPFAFLTMLGTEKKKNQGTTYWEPRFTVGTMFKNPEQLQLFNTKREAAYEYIDNINAAITSKSSATKPNVPMPSAVASVSSLSITPNDQFEVIAPEVNSVPTVMTNDLPPWATGMAGIVTEPDIPDTIFANTVNAAPAIPQAAPVIQAAPKADVDPNADIIAAIESAMKGLSK